MLCFEYLWLIVVHKDFWKMLYTQDKGVTGKIKVTPLDIMQFLCSVLSQWRLD